METRLISNGVDRSFADRIAAGNPDNEIVCCFYTLVIRVAALDEKYPGGHMAFLMAHQGWSNEHLLAVFLMGADRRKSIRDLERYHLTEGPDWVYLSTGPGTCSTLKPGRPGSRAGIKRAISMSATPGIRADLGMAAGARRNGRTAPGPPPKAEGPDRNQSPGKGRCLSRWHHIW